MAVEDDLKALILERFKSVRAFAAAIDKPYSSINNIFSRGVSGAGISMVIPLCRALEIDTDALADGEIKPKCVSKADEILTSDDLKLLTHFRSFNEEGQAKLLDTASDMAQLDQYKKGGEYDSFEKEE